MGANAVGKAHILLLLILLIMGANAVGKAHILLLLILIIIFPFPPRFSVRYSSRSEGPTGIKNTPPRARRPDSVCLYFYFSLFERNSGKLGISGQILNRNLHGEALTRQFWAKTASPWRPPNSAIQHHRHIIQGFYVTGKTQL